MLTNPVFHICIKWFSIVILILILHIPAVLCVDRVKDTSELFDFLAVKEMGEDLYMAEGREERIERR
jgi:hypothetical protein